MYNCSHPQYSFCNQLVLFKNKIKIKTKTRPSHVTFKLTSHSIVGLSRKQCNDIIKEWFYCLTLESKGRFIVNECVRLAISYHLYIISIYLKFRACYITGQWGEFTVKNVTSYLHTLSWHFIVIFHLKNCDFIIFISFFDEVSNFPNRILINQKPEQVIRNCQWNCMQ